ncbi:FAD-binding oxidoreductase [Dyella jejuensis]|uniref:FAD-binding oxidoreductase n=1 Tax=Dyella jejuensis TaxID=1432009 RepID=A0ABW8JLP2_9GAMM
MQAIPRIAVIGAGVAGVASAIALAEQGYHVSLFDAYPLLTGTSNNTPGRLGMGFHYATPNTAAMLFDTTIDLVKRYPQATLGRELPHGHPLRRAQYFVARDSLFGTDEISAVHDMLIERYAKAWESSGRRLPFGEPGAFLRRLREDEYRGYVNPDEVQMGVDTAEVLMDWPEVRARLERRVRAMPRIDIYEGHRVEALSHHGKFHWRVDARDPNGQLRTFDAQLVINCAWQNIDAINRMANLPIQSGAINRLKVLLRAKLPPILQQHSSMFFCMGPFAMFSNMNDGKGMMTYAPVTNISAAQAGDGHALAELNRILRHGVDAAESQRLIDGLRGGVARFIPAMRDALPVALKFGVVRTRSECDLWDKRSDVHHRDYTGVQADAADFITNAAVKLIYFARNADLVVELVSQRVPLTRTGRVA